MAARSKNIEITVEENTARDFLKMIIQDDGIGMDKETVAKVIDPFFTSRTTRKVGLGIPLLKAAAEACNGYLTIHSNLAVGTQVEVLFQDSHIDRMPLGDLAGTILSLLVAFPQTRWLFTYIVNAESFVLDSAVITTELEGVPLTEPSILGFIREFVETGINNLQSTHNPNKVIR